MKTPKEYANELIRDFYNITVDDTSQYGMEWQMAKQCALIAVDVVLNNPKNYMRGLSEDLHDEYWQQVKTEIQNS